jgi:intracellular multiplication protein IcmK
MILCGILVATPVLAAESPQTGSQGTVLGQTANTAPENENKTGQPATTTGNPANGKSDAQALFEESLRQMMPLDDGQIQEYRSRSDQRERALRPVSPALASRTVRVSLEPGGKPVTVRTTANVATSLVFHDSTGQPWPITSVTNGGPNFFQVLRPELPDGNLLNVMPTKAYGASTIVVTLEKRDIPLVIRLESDSVRSPERKADALVLFQLAHQGPKAALPLVADIKETVDSAMLACLDGAPPAKAVRGRFEHAPDKFTVWKLGDVHYIRTSHALMWPAWTAVVNGAGGVKCYEAPATSRLMLSINGKIRTLVVKGGAK